jgi:hypothetical protein
MQSVSDIARVPIEFVLVCAATARTAEKKTETTPKHFMVLDFAAFAAVRQMQDAEKCAEVTS